MDFPTIVTFTLVPINIFFAIYFNNPPSYVAAAICFLLGCLCLLNSY